MYLVSRETEGDGQFMFDKSERFFEEKEFADSLKSKLGQEWVRGRALVMGCNNIDILVSLFTNERLTSIDLLNTRRVIREEALKAAGDSPSLAERVHEITSFKDQTYDFVFEMAIFDKASKTTDHLKDILNDKCHYLYAYSLYEEMTFKKKIVSLLINKYGLDITLLNFKSIELPVVVLDIDKNTQLASNKQLVMRVGGNAQTIEYSFFLAKLKEAYLATMPDVKGVGDLVPGRRIIYDANDPEIDQVIPMYNIKILDNRDEKTLGAVGIDS